MPSESSLKPLTVPPFASKLPAEFIEGLDDRGRYLYQTIDKITQTQDWLTERATIDAGTLSEVKTQVYNTNGRLLAAESSIKEIRAVQEEAKPAIKMVELAIAAAKNKWTYVAIAGLVFFVAPWLIIHAPTPTQFFTFVFGA